MAEPKKKKGVKTTTQLLSFAVFKPEDEKYSILIGDHPELIGQFVRSSPRKNAATPLCTEDVKDIGPNRVLYSHRQKWVDARGDVRGSC